MTNDHELRDRLKRLRWRHQQQFDVMVHYDKDRTTWIAAAFWSPTYNRHVDAYAEGGSVAEALFMLAKRFKQASEPEPDDESWHPEETEKHDDHERN
jgi:hypothetical protein